jgi:hypothetical protein
VKERVIAVDVTILLGRKVDAHAVGSTALVCGVHLVPAVDLEREVLDPHVVVAMGTAIRRAQPQHRTRSRILEIDDLLGPSVGRVADLFDPSQRR